MKASLCTRQAFSSSGTLTFNILLEQMGLLPALRYRAYRWVPWKSFTFNGDWTWWLAFNVWIWPSILWEGKSPIHWYIHWTSSFLSGCCRVSFPKRDMYTRCHPPEWQRWVEGHATARTGTWPVSPVYSLRSCLRAFCVQPCVEQQLNREGQIFQSGETLT